MFSFILLFGLFMSIDHVAPKDRKLNIEIKTELEFNKRADVELLDKAQWYLDQIKNILQDTFGKKEISRSHYKFTDFLRDTLNLMKTMGDAEVNKIMKALSSEFRRFNSKFNIIDLNKYKNLRKFTLNYDVSVKNVREKINNLLLTLEKKTQDFYLQLVNSLYNKTYEKKLKNFVKNLELYKEGKLSDLEDIIRKGVKSVFINRFSNLDESAKMDMKNLIPDILMNMDKRQRECIKTPLSYIQKEDPKQFLNMTYRRCDSDSLSIEDKTRKLMSKINQSENNVRKINKKNETFSLKISTSKSIINKNKNDYFYVKRRNSKKQNNSNTHKKQFNKKRSSKSGNEEIKIGNDKYSSENLNYSRETEENKISKTTYHRQDSKQTNTDIAFENKEKIYDEINTVTTTTGEKYYNNKSEKPQNKSKTDNTTSKSTTKRQISHSIDQDDLENTSTSITSTTEAAKTNNIFVLVTTDTRRRGTQINMTKNDDGDTTFIADDNEIIPTTPKPIDSLISDFLNRSESPGEARRSQQLIEKMKADLSMLFSTNTAKNYTTERQDSFQEMEKVFDFV